MARNEACLVALIAILVSGPVFAQPAAGTTGQTRRSPNPPWILAPSLLKRTAPFKVAE
jgi:hypothetical protein